MMSRIAAWLFDPLNAASVGAWGLILGVFGTILTLVGLFATYRQAKKARSTSAAASAAVEQFQFRLQSYESSNDLSHASGALENTRRYLTNDLWKDASDTYDEARRAAVRLLHKAFIPLTHVRSCAIKMA